MEEPNESSQSFEYWKQLYYKIFKEFQNLQENFNEYQESSLELEAELEQQNNELEKKNHELENDYSILSDQFERYKNQTTQIFQENAGYIEKLENEKETLMKLNYKTEKRKRELEQVNDDFERKQRELMMTNEMLADKLNKAVEEQILLQTELEMGKNSSQEKIERLKQQVKELRAEIESRNKKEKKPRRKRISLPSQIKQDIKKGIENNLKKSSIQSRLKTQIIFDETEKKEKQTDIQFPEDEQETPFSFKAARSKSVGSYKNVIPPKKSKTEILGISKDEKLRDLKSRSNQSPSDLIETILNLVKDIQNKSEIIQKFINKPDIKN
ncbi:nuclear distribution protein nude [Anaeramoeba ignava]|uniref:Nuclear distribution protein nude n=1 Tax=Anaeramoeba ignava TaxID=1746090 RepID=A0A9Q0LNM9_ANAIG|nr:nuclear distribution protein nude [Anaeramoeba ignava]